MKSLRLKERFKILRDRLYFHVILKEELDRIDGKLLLLLDHQLDIRELKPAIGDLRLKQEVCFQILRILKRIAKAESISFWLDFGTLLGAVRHGGFVPWDDDLDISLLNSDFDRFCSVLRGKLPPQLVLLPGKDSPESEIGIARVIEKNTGFYIDIYPYDRILGALRSDSTATAWQLDYDREFEAVYRFGQSNGLTANLKRRILDWYATHAQGDGTEEGVAVSMFYYQANAMYRKVFSAVDYFPLEKHVFEGEEFLIPRNPERVLYKIYGDILRFPRDAGNLAGHGHTLATPQTIRRVIDQLNEIVRIMDNSEGVRGP